MKRWLSITLIIALLATGLLAGCAAEKEEVITPEEFYKGKTIEMPIGGKVGGGTDMICRLIAPYVKEYTGAAVVLPVNCVKATTIEAGNWVRDATPDGLVIALVATLSIFTEQLTESPGVRYDAQKFEYLGIHQQGAHALFVTPDSWTSLEDFRKEKGLKFAATTGGATNALWAAVVIEALGLEDAKIVLGYKGTTGCAEAVFKGETDANMVIASTGKVYAERDLVRCLGVADFEERPAAVGMPLLPELIELSQEKEDWLKKCVDAMTVGKVLITTPGIPKDKVEFLQGVFAKIMADERFLKDMEDVELGYVVNYSHEEAEKVCKITFENAEFFEEMKALVEKYRAD